MKELAYKAGYEKEWMLVAYPNKWRILSPKKIIAILIHPMQYEFGKIDAINDQILD